MEWTLPTLAFVLLAYAAVSRRVEGTSLTAAMFFTGAGLVVGAETLGLVDPSTTGEAVKILAEATLALVLFSDASRIDLRKLRGELGLPCRLLGIGLPLTILAGFVVGLLLLDGLAWSEALLLAVILAPTDAALGQTVVTLKRLPLRVRQSLNVESGLNDGICVPLFLVVLAVAQAEEENRGLAHAIRLVAEKIGYGAAAGIAAGVIAAAVVVLAGRHGLVSDAWVQVIPLAAAVLAYTAGEAVGGSGFIAAFVGGATFGRRRHGAGGEVSYLIEEAGALLAAVTFVVFGAALLGPALTDVTLPVAAYAVLSLTLVRMAPVGLALVGTGARRPTVGFLGWFGPRGLASIVFALLLVEEGGLPNDGLLLTAAYVTVGLSVLAHGITAAPFARRYADWAVAHPEAHRPLPGATPELPWRARIGEPPG